MAETTDTPDIGISNEDLFKGSLAPDPASTPPAPPHPDDENRDVRGRFRAQGGEQPAPTPAPAPGSPQPPAPGSPPAPSPAPPAPQPGGDQPTPQPGATDDGHVPSWRLREEREQRERLAQQLQDSTAMLRDMQRRMQEMEKPQQPAQPVDPLLDPDGYRKQIESNFNTRLQTIQLENNLQLNRLQHGPVFDEAYRAFMQAAENDPGFGRLIVQSPNPGGAMVGWYKRATVLQKVGDDPEKFVEQEIARRLADPVFLGQAIERAKAFAAGQPPAAPGGAAPRPNNVTQLPPTLARVPSGSPTESAADLQFQAAQSMDNEELFRQALPPPRRQA